MELLITPSMFILKIMILHFFVGGASFEVCWSYCIIIFFFKFKIDNSNKRKGNEKLGESYEGKEDRIRK